MAKFKPAVRVVILERVTMTAARAPRKKKGRGFGANLIYNPFVKKKKSN